MKTIVLKKLIDKHSFGYDRYIPACEASSKLLKLKGTKKTFNLYDVNILKEFFEVIIRLTVKID